MTSKLKFTGLIGFMAVVLAPAIGFAAEGAAAAGSSEGFFSNMGLGLVVGLGFAAGGAGIGMGNAVSGAVTAMARNPGFYGRIFTSMLIGLALIESLVIYTLVVVLILLYANPFL